MDINESMERIPHRYPFLFVDRVIEKEENKKIVAIKNMTMNEEFFQGHFPGHPVMPGVIIIEAMAQALGILMMEPGSGKIPYFMAIDNAKFRRPVKPGDQVKFEVEVLKLKGTIIKAKGTASVDGKLAAEADLMFSIQDK